MERRDLGATFGALALALTLGAAGPAAADDDRKMDRQIELFDNFHASHDCSSQASAGP